MSFLYGAYFSQHCHMPYIPHKTTPHSSQTQDVCTNCSFQFFFFPFLFFLLSQTSINAYILFWYIKSTFLTKRLNQFLHSLQFSASPSLPGKLSIAWSISNLSLIKKTPKAGVLLETVFGISESFHTGLNSQSHANVQPKNAIHNWQYPSWRATCEMTFGNNFSSK